MRTWVEEQPLKALTIGVGKRVRSRHGQASFDKVMPQPNKARKNFPRRAKVSVCANQPLQDKVGPEWPRLGYCRIQEEHTWLQSSITVLLPRLWYKHSSKPLLSQREGTESNNPIILTFPMYSAWDHSAPSWKGDETGYSAMRTAPLSGCLGLKSNGDVSQMHCSCNNRALILCMEKNSLWEDLCLKTSKINTVQGSGPVRQESLPWQGTPSVNLFVLKYVVWFC